MDGSGSGSGCLLNADHLTQILLIAGGLNWGSIALVGCSPSGSVGSCATNSGDLVTQVAQLLAQGNKDLGCTIDRVIKALVGVSAVYQALQLLYGLGLVATPPPNACLLPAA